MTSSLRAKKRQRNFECFWIRKSFRLLLPHRLRRALTHRAIELISPTSQLYLTTNCRFVQFNPASKLVFFPSKTLVLLLPQITLFIARLRVVCSGHEKSGLGVGVGSRDPACCCSYSRSTTAGENTADWISINYRCGY